MLTKRKLMILKIAIPVVSILTIVAAFYSLATVGNRLGLLVALPLGATLFALIKRLEALNADPEDGKHLEPKGDHLARRSFLRRAAMDTGLWTGVRFILCSWIMILIFAVAMTGRFSVLIGIKIGMIIPVLCVAWEIWVRLSKRRRKRLDEDAGH
ncbi:MAG: hypothetical protein KOO62_02035 [candidate division Zixibacteria bacterium]|nr:hypothetical protein [candidate division Zixibacteria bacterium]